MEKKLLKKNLSSLILACLILVMYDYGAYRFLAYSTRAYWSALIIPVPVGNIRFLLVLMTRSGRP